MAVRGQKFELDLGDDAGGNESTRSSALPVVDLIGNVRERETTHAAPPAPPAPRPTTGGFPTHKKRLQQSRFKSARSAEADSSPAATRVPEVPPSTQRGLVDDERRQIDKENQDRLASMTDAEIQAERQELLENINPAIIEALFRRSKLESGDNQADFPGLDADVDAASATKSKPKKPAKKVAFEEPVADTAAPATEPELSEDAAAASDDFHGEVSAGTIHFPRPEQPPELDPNSPSFLEDLHRKYFPSLPADPEKLEWMRPASETSTYSPSQSGLNPKDIRFSFSGALIPPATAAEIPVTAGLHHHGDAPDAAGYTIAELARLARSKVAAQRCIAFQTLGRILYRLGRGEFGDPSGANSGTVGAEDTLDELARGLWREVEKEQVISICTNESEGKSMTGQRHVSAQTYATEALWLWQKGGGRRWRTD